MPPILRFTGAREADPAITRWFEQRPGPLGALARRWFDTMRHCGPEVRELLHDGCPVVCVADAPFAYVDAFSAHVNVGFFHGAALIDAAGLLEGRGKRMRHVKLRPGQPLDSVALDALVRAAYADILARL
jgi:hypothetical protein